MRYCGKLNKRIALNKLMFVRAILMNVWCIYLI